MTVRRLLLVLAVVLTVAVVVLIYAQCLIPDGIFREHGSDNGDPRAAGLIVSTFLFACAAWGGFAWLDSRERHQRDVGTHLELTSIQIEELRRRLP